MNINIILNIITIIIWVSTVLFNVKYIDDTKHLKFIMILELIVIIMQIISNIY